MIIQYKNQMLDQAEYNLQYNNIQSMKIIIKLLLAYLYLFFFSYSNCPSESIDYSINYAINGNFTNFSIAPWSADQPEVGLGSNYNSNWGSTMVASLDTGKNQKYKQTMVLPPGKFFFTIDFASRQNTNSNSNGIRIDWNSKNVLNVPSPSNFAIHTETLQLTAKNGQNIIVIEGKGKQDGKGTTISNIAIHPMTQYHRQIINGVCTCQTGFFDNGYNYPCVACNLIVDHCTSCNLNPDLSQLTAACLANITSGQNCTFGAFTCLTCQSGYFPTTTGCQPIQIDPLYYEPDWKLEYVSCNKYTAEFDILMTNYFTIGKIITNNTQSQVNSYNVSTNTAANSYKIKIQSSYQGDISEQIITFIVYFQTTLGTVNTQATIIKMKSSNIPLIQYTEGICSKAQKIKDLTISVAVLSYITMIISLFSLKIVGLQLFGVLQLAFFSLSTHDRVNYFLTPLTKWKYMNGLNFNSNQPFKNVSNSINNLGYTDNFFQNINFMYAILLFDMLLGFILNKISKRINSKKLEKVSRYMQKQIFITIFLFNSLNISFSIGTHFKYANPSTTNLYWLGTIGAISGIFVYLYAVVLMQVVQEKQFGEFKSKFKKNCVNRFYIPLSIIYRFILGVYIAVQNQWYLGTLFIIAASIAYILFNIVNLPFMKAYQNYRANLCHVIQLIILLVSNYYRSMKYNCPTEEKAQLYDPAIFQLICIFFCMAISMGCLGYQIYLMIKKYKERKQIEDRNKQKKSSSEDSLDKDNKMRSNQNLNETQNDMEANPKN